MSKVIDLTNKKFGRLLVITRLSNYIEPNGNQVVKWECLCDCGTTISCSSKSLRTGHTKSCGCINKTHGKAGTSEYICWKAMKSRCFSKSNHAYSKYGGRGITVCDEWKNSFENFYKDMGEKPTSQHSIDRIDGTKGYSKSNCRWSTKTEQADNRKSSIIIDVGDEKLSLKRYCELKNIPYSTIQSRIFKMGWSVKEAITKPVRKIKSNETKSI